MKLIQPAWFSGLTFSCGSGWTNPDDYVGPGSWIATTHTNSTLGVVWAYTAGNQYANTSPTTFPIALGSGMYLGTDDASRITWTVTHTDSTGMLTISGPFPQTTLISDNFYIDLNYTDAGDLRNFGGSSVTLQAKLDGVDVCSPYTIYEFNESTNIVG